MDKQMEVIMSEKINFDQVRGAAMERIERSERNFKLAFFGAAIWEGLFMIAFLLAADLSNRLHLLLLIATVGSYTILILGLLALGAHVSRNAHRIIKAIELLGSRTE